MIFFFLSRLYTQGGAQIHNSQNKSHMLHQLNQPGTPRHDFLFEMSKQRLLPSKNQLYSISLGLIIVQGVQILFVLDPLLLFYIYTILTS